MSTISSVPGTTRKPGVYAELDTTGARAGLAVSADRVLLIGHRLGSGSKAHGELAQVFSAAQAAEFFGSGTPLALMVAALLKQFPYLSELWCVGLSEDGGGAAATGSIGITSSGGAGTLYVWVGAHRVQIGVSADDSPTDVANNLVAAINGDTDLPLSAVGAGASCNLTAKCKGTAGNHWPLHAEFVGTGNLVYTLTDPSGGATDASITDALDAAFPEQFSIIGCEMVDATVLGLLGSHLDDVSGPLEQRPGVAVVGQTDTLSTATTLAAVNSGRIWMPLLRNAASHPAELAAACIGALAAEDDRALPLNFVELKGILGPWSATDRLSRTEQESCLANGVSPMQVAFGGKVQIVRSVTTYTTDAYGASDDSLLDIQTIRVLDAVRYGLVTAAQRAWGQSKIADEAKSPNTTDPDKMRATFIGWLFEYETIGYLENVAEHKDLVTVERDGANRVNVELPADIVDGLHVIAARISLII